MWPIRNLLGNRLPEGSPLKLPAASCRLRAVIEIALLFLVWRTGLRFTGYGILWRTTPAEMSSDTDGNEPLVSPWPSTAGYAEAQAASPSAHPR